MNNVNAILTEQGITTLLMSGGTAEVAISVINLRPFELGVAPVMDQRVRPNDGRVLLWY